VQAMVFGNMGDDSQPVLPSRAIPPTGEKLFYGEFLVNAQGEDVVAGIRTPQPTSRSLAKPAGGDLPSMEEVMPDVFARTRADIATSSKPITATCKTSSSRLRQINSGCCKREMANAPPAHRSKSL